MIKLTCPKSTLRDRGTRWNLKFSHQAVESRVKIITRLSLTLRQISSRGHGKGWYIRNRYLFLSRNRKYKISNNKSGRFSWTQLTISQFSKQEKTIHGNSRKKGRGSKIEKPNGDRKGIRMYIWSVSVFFCACKLHIHTLYRD